MPKQIIELKPIKESTKDYDEIEKRIKAVFRRELYFPLLRSLRVPRRTIENSIADLIKAIQSGRVTYSSGTFSGQFNAGSSKELKFLGATWDSKGSSWKIPETSLPREIREAVSLSRSRFKENLAQIDKRLAAISPEELAGKIKVDDLFDSALWKVDDQLHKSMEKITITPKLSASQRQKIASEWQTNMDLWITDFTQDEISKLREDLQKTIYSGNRYESVISTIQDSYEVTANKAKFLAQQETGLLMAKFKETRYLDAGVPEYVWGCVHMPKDRSPGQHTPGNVRYSHGVLEGKVFRWDNPPITSAPGEPVRRNNPGQDYRCRCFAKPIVRF